MGHTSKWYTLEEERLLREWNEERLHIRTQAERLGRTEEAVAMKRRRMGLRMPPSMQVPAVKRRQRMRRRNGQVLEQECCGDPTDRAAIQAE